MSESQLITGLNGLYSKIGNPWVQHNSLVLNTARHNKLAIGGSIGLSISRKSPIKEPGDIDLFTDSYEDAWNFTTYIMKYLSAKSGTYGKISFNNDTAYTLEGVKNHIRIVGPKFWLPICVMVMDKPIRTFLWNRMKVQFFDDIVVAAKKTTVIDGKPRVELLLNLNFEDDIDFDDDTFTPRKTVHPFELVLSKVKQDRDFTVS